MSYSHAIYCQQIGLKTLGFDPGPADGLDGPKTRRALKESEKARFGETSKSSLITVPRPAPTYRDKAKIFGPHGRESALERVKLPWSMRIAWGGGVRTTLRLHKLIAGTMIEALSEILEKKGIQWIKAHGLDLFGGDYVNRPSRTGRSISDHAFGIALDLNPEANGLWQRWEPGKKADNGTKQMPREAVRIFQRYGFQVGFRRNDGSRRDMMHIAYVNRS